jgi:hypothetical protein
MRMRWLAVCGVLTLAVALANVVEDEPERSIECRPDGGGPDAVRRGGVGIDSLAKAGLVKAGPVAGGWGTRPTSAICCPRRC